MGHHPKFQIAPLAVAITTALYTAPFTFAAEAPAATRLEEIIVTGRKRVESVMEVPASIQALTSDDILAMGARGMHDYSRFIPSLNVITYGAGDTVVVFRGAISDESSELAQGTSSVYLDEVSVSSTSVQPSIRMVDIERIEALAGPQGTLYGSDAVAGTLRIITKKPEMNTFDILADVSGRNGSEGEDSFDHSIVVNLPLVEDRLALRLVGFTAKDGGFIDNVFGHTPDSDTTGKALPSGFGNLDNADFVEKNWNDSEIDGWRAALKWDINEDWTATFSALHQSNKSGALNDFDPFVGDLEVVRFFDNYRDDEYDLYSLVVEADLGFAQLVSATSFYDREAHEVYDNTAYNHQWAGTYCQTYAYYQDYLAYLGYFQDPDGSGTVFWPAYCKAPTVDGDFLTVRDYAQDTDRFTQEFRLSSQGETLDWLVGFFYEEINHDYVYDFARPTRSETNPGGPGTNLYQESISLQYFEGVLGQALPNSTTYWYETSKTDWEQKAIFGEVVWHATDRLDLTVGGRYFDRENRVLFWTEFPRGNLAELQAGLPDISGREKEFVPKVSVSYNLTDESMIYGLWTEGNRPSGQNRGRGDPLLPITYEPDTMTNWEAGYKATFADGAARISLITFVMDWEDYQIEIVDPSVAACPLDGPSKIAGVCGQPWQNVIANGGDASITGTSLELDWAISPNFVVGFNAEWLNAETDSGLDLSGDGLDNVTTGQRLPLSPDFTGAAWATYDWPMPSIGGSGFARLQWSFHGETLSNLEHRSTSDDEPNPRWKNSAFNIGDFSIGLRNETWEASLFLNNIKDERARYQTGWGLFEWAAASVQDGRAHTVRYTTNRPREFGVRLIYRWAGN
ncbi:MAG TPA: TonB-dependent receptor [Gammaproteobacteria bacterium]|nr:TonB-dependent receptor [Gammaproteobacteria bacterium]